MEDFGLSGAMNMALHLFIQAGRRSGRTEQLLQRVNGGDRVVVSTRAERLRLENRLRERGKKNVKVVDLPPHADPFVRLGTNRDGATHFEHTWVEMWWARRIETSRAELEVIENALSTLPPAGGWPNDMARRFSRFTPLDRG